MTDADVQLVREIYDAWERGDYQSVDWADPDIEFVVAAGPEPTDVRGIEAMRDVWRGWLRAWAGFQVLPDEIVEVADRVLVLTRYRAHGRSSGVSVDDLPGANLFTVRNGRVVRLEVHADRDSALKAAGLGS